MFHVKRRHGAGRDVTDHLGAYILHDEGCPNEIKCEAIVFYRDYVYSSELGRRLGELLLLDARFWMMLVRSCNAGAPFRLRACA